MENCGKCRKTNVPQYGFYFNFVPTILILVGLLAQLMPFAQATGYPIGTVLTPKRIAFPTVTDVSSDDGYPDYQSGVRYDEYPIVVPKRAALILDRILKEIESAKDSNQLINDWSPIGRPVIPAYHAKGRGNRLHKGLNNLFFALGSSKHFLIFLQQSALQGCKPWNETKYHLLQTDGLFFEKKISLEC